MLGYDMRKTALMLFLCVAGAFLNIGLNVLCTITGIPLYFDTVMTVAITFFGGVFWGMLTGFLTNAIGHSFQFWGWEGYLFALCNMAAAFITYLFIRFFPGELDLREQYRVSAVYSSLTASSMQFEAIMGRMVALMLLSFALCLAMSILGGLIAVIIQLLRNGAEYNPASEMLNFTMFKQGMPLIVREILARIPMNIIDRLIAAFGGYGVAVLAYLLDREQRTMNREQ